MLGLPLILSLLGVFIFIANACGSINWNDEGEAVGMMVGFLISILVCLTFFYFGGHL